MTTYPSGQTEATTPAAADQTAPFDGALVPFPTEYATLPGIPNPETVKALLIARIDDAVVHIRRQRGAVHVEEDVHFMVRAVRGLQNLVKRYIAVLQAIVVRLDGVIEEELVEAVGEQNGIPNGALRVPTAGGGSIRVAAKTENRHDIDARQVVSGIVFRTSEHWTDRAVREPDTAAVPGEAPHEFAIDCVMDALELMGAQTMKVTRVQALADKLSIEGYPTISSTVRTAIHTTRVMKGVDVTETQPKSA